MQKTLDTNVQIQLVDRDVLGEWAWNKSWKERDRDRQTEIDLDSTNFNQCVSFLYITHFHFKKRAEGQWSNFSLNFPGQWQKEMPWNACELKTTYSAAARPTVVKCMNHIVYLFHLQYIPIFFYTMGILYALVNVEDKFSYHINFTKYDI